jgi:hypothetical protein
MQEGGKSKINSNLIIATLSLTLYSQPALVTYVTAGFPTPQETPDVLLAMEAGGAGRQID